MSVSAIPSTSVFPLYSSSIFYLSRFIVLSPDTDALRLHAQVDILGHETHAILAVLACHVVGYGEYAMIRFILPEELAYISVFLDVRVYDDGAARVENDALAEQAVAHQRVELTGELPGVVVDYFVAFFKVVHLFEQSNRYYYIVLLE